MRAISSKKNLMYYVKMYRRITNITLVLSITSMLLTVVLIYYYLIQPERTFYASATSYNITKLTPLS